MSTNIVVRIIGELKDAGFIKAEKRSSALEKKFDKLGKTAKRTFLAIAGIGALKKSITAFAAEDKAVRQLTVSLNNLGLAYNVPALEAFIKQTELATGVSGEQLRPAIRDLVATTLDAEQATQLLNTALDLAAGTGASLDATVNALTRAFNGNFASLGKIQTRYTSAELEAMGFAEAIATLNSEFKGTSAAAADSYQGKIDRLGTALDDAAKIIGEDVLQALEKLADGDFDKVLSGIANAANFLGSAFNSLAFSLAYTREFLGTGFRIDAGEQAKLDAIKNQFFPTPGFGGTRPNPALLRDYAKQLDLQKKIVKERDKAVKLSEKDKKNQAALARAKAVFDLEKIQIEAALQGKITEEERKRLLLMRAILQEDAVTATKLAKELNDLQTNTQKLADTLINIGKMPSPFSSWKDDVVAAIDAINDGMKKSVTDFIADFRSQIRQVPQEVIMQSLASQAEADMMLGDYYAALAQLGESKAELEVLYGQFGGNLVKGLSISEKQLIDRYFREGMTGNIQNPFRSDIDLNEIIQQIIARNELYKTVRPTIDAIGIQEESVAALGALAAEAAARAADDLLQESILGNLNLGLTPEMNITVNVEGSVISAEDLAETITDIQYEYQRSGKNLLLSSTKL